MSVRDKMPSIIPLHFRSNILTALLINNMSIAEVGIYNGTSSDFRNVVHNTIEMTDTRACTMDDKYCDGIMYPFLMKVSNESRLPPPFIPIFGYPYKSDGETTQLCLYDYDGDSLQKPIVADDESNAYTIVGQFSNADQTTLSIPGHVFVEGDDIYVTSSDASAIAKVKSVNGDLVNVNLQSREWTSASLDNNVSIDTNRIIFVGITAPLSMTQHRLIDNMMAIPTILAGTATINTDPTGFRPGDVICIETEDTNDTVRIRFSKTGTPIGVVISSETTPPSVKICLKHSLIPLW